MSRQRNTTKTAQFRTPRARLILLATLLVELLLFLGKAGAQTPTGAIAGVVVDASGGLIPAVQILIENKETGLTRTMVTTTEGDYSAAGLPAGVYELTVETPGFQRLVREAIVEAGSTTTVDLSLAVGAVTETLVVEEAAPQIRYDSNAIGGVVARVQIDGLPLNGRSFLELAKLEPGAQHPTRASNNRMFIPLLGAPVGQNGRATRITVDGGSIMQVGNGGSAMGFSQEVVQEFQVSTVNFDLSTGITASGAVNIVTRSGGNDWHGSGFFFFRDHNLAAYPGLARVAFNPDPFFQRRQFGFTLAGPLRKDRAFVLGTFERNEQRGVVSTQLLTPEFTSLSRITPSPSYVNQFSIRADFRPGDRNFGFLRHSHEGISSYGPTGAVVTAPRTFPSAWARQPGWTDQSIVGLTSVPWSNLVNDFRFSYFFVSSAEQPPRNTDCPECLGIGAPSIRVMPDLFIGSSNTSRVLGRRYHLSNVVAWQKGSHRIRFGGDWEMSRGGRTDLNNDPVAMSLFSPAQVAAFNALPSTPLNRRVPLPASFLTVEDILQLPVQSFTVGIGDPYVPQEDFGKTRIYPVVHFFYQDTWRLHRQLSVNYGLAWTYDAPLNYDLSKPAFLSPLLGEHGLGATRKNWKNFSPLVGFAWSTGRDGKTAIRGGAGIYYDFTVPFLFADSERVALGPRGVGRGTYSNLGIRNPLAGIPGVPAGTLLTILRGNPTLFTGAALLRALPLIRAALAQQRGNPNNRDFSVTNIEVDKTGVLLDSSLPASSAIHASFGMQRELLQDLVLSADLGFRKFAHLGTAPAPDLNRFSSSRGPVLPICTDAGRSDPKAFCSLGPIRLFSGLGSARYAGLLVRADKRFTRGWQFLGSYAYSSNVGNSFDRGLDLENLLENVGPLDRDVRHILNLSGLVPLPLRLQAGFFVTYNSKIPSSPFLGGLDLNGDGTVDDLLPGTTLNQFNRSLGKEDLRRLVDEFNKNHAGKRDAQGRTVRPVSLPASFGLGDRLLTQDLRLSRMLVFEKGWYLTLIGEVFNLFNIANHSGRSEDLLSPGFGQPTSRVTQVFGSGGPRSFQFAARLSF